MNTAPDANQSELEGSERFYGRTFSSAHAPQEPVEPPEPRAPLFSRRQLLAAALPAALAVGCLIGAGVIDTGRGQAAPSAQEESELFALRDEAKELESMAGSLPKAYDVQRALLSSTEAAKQVAQLQESYGFYAQRAQANGGTIPEDQAGGLNRRLSPYFATASGDAGRAPWYLMAVDAERGEGSGLVATFTPGFIWSPLDPQVVDEHGRVRMLWMAIERWPHEGKEPRVLAWASAEYDVLNRTFANLQVAATEVGAALSVTGENKNTEAK